MKNEEAIRYDAITDGTVTETVAPEALFDARISLKGNYQAGAQIANRQELEKLCTELLSDCATEEIHLICVNAQCYIIAEAMISRGDLSSVNAPVSSIAKVALLSNAHSVFLTHNHPGGTCRPSNEDIRSTMLIEKALKMFDIQLLDHMIVAQGSGTYSMRQHGDF